MKKLMLAAAIVCAAVAVQATTINWGLSAGQSLEGFTDGTMYLIYHGTTTPTWSALADLTKFDEETITKTLGAEIAGTATYSADSKTGSTFVGIGDPLSSISKGGSNKFYQIVIADDGGKIAYTAASSSVTINNQVTGSGITKVATAFTTVTAQTVPEPTSALLLMLGIAGLALKRKLA